MEFDILITVIFIIMPVICGLICLYYSLDLLKKARILEDNPTSKIRSAAQGFVELSGISKSFLPNKPIYGKFTGTPCAWYECVVETYYKTTVGLETAEGWNVLDRYHCQEPFLLDDGTGECAIFPEGAEINVSGSIQWQGRTRYPTPRPTSFWDWLFFSNGGPYRYTEFRLELDTPLFVSGRFQTIHRDNPIIAGTMMQDYFAKEDISRLHILNGENLSPDEHFIISSRKPSKVIRAYRIKAVIFFIVFIFFCSLTVNSTYPMVKDKLGTWLETIKKRRTLSPSY